MTRLNVEQCNMLQERKDDFTMGWNVSSWDILIWMHVCFNLNSFRIFCNYSQGNNISWDLWVNDIAPAQSITLQVCSYSNKKYLIKINLELVKLMSHDTVIMLKKIWTFLLSILKLHIVPLNQFSNQTDLVKFKCSFNKQEWYVIKRGLQLSRYGTQTSIKICNSTS